MIEYFYLKYKEGDMTCQQMPVPGGYVIDLRYMLQIKVRNPQKQRKVLRSLDNRHRLRPGTNFRWNDSVVLMPKKNGLKYSEEDVMWLGWQWVDANKRHLTVNDIMVGIHKEEKVHQMKINFAENPKFTSALVSNMIFTWKRIFKLHIVADFSAPLTRKILEDPCLKIVENLFYIYSMETFVYSLLNVSSRNKEASKIDTLGPLSLALA